MLIRITLTLLMGISFVGNADAYIDFGTGSYVLQILAASAIGFIFLIKSYYQKIKQFFIRKTPSEADIAQHTEGQE